MKELTVKLNFDIPNYFFASGSLIHQTCMQFVHEINTHLNSFVDTATVDISNLEHLDGSGIGVIITLAICLRHQRKQLIIILPKNDTQPKQILKLLKLTYILKVE